MRNTYWFAVDYNGTGRLVKRCLHLLRRHTGRNQSKDMEDSQ